MYVNINTQQLSETLPKWIQETQTSNPTLEQCAEYGWRIALPVTPPEEGYERLSPPVYADEPGSLYAAARVHDTLITDRLSREEAARAAWLEGYDEMPRALRVPSLELPATDGHVYSLVVDDGVPEPVMIQRESKRLTNAELRAALAERKAARAARRAEMDGEKGKASAAGASANAANSVPALRAQVAELARIVALLAERLR
jgi:hypothetical protein